MPIVVNHRGPGFREYSRTPAEKKIIELEDRLANLEEKLAQGNPEQANTPTSSNNEVEEDSTSE